MLHQLLLLAAAHVCFAMHLFEAAGAVGTAATFVSWLSGQLTPALAWQREKWQLFYADALPTTS